MSDADDRFQERAAITDPVERIKAAQRRCQRGEHLYSKWVDSSIDTQYPYNDALKRNPVWDGPQIALALGINAIYADCWSKKCFFCHKTIHCLKLTPVESLEFES